MFILNKIRYDYVYIYISITYIYRYKYIFIKNIPVICYIHYINPVIYFYVIHNLHKITYLSKVISRPAEIKETQSYHHYCVERLFLECSFWNSSDHDKKFKRQPIKLKFIIATASKCWCPYLLCVYQFIKRSYCCCTAVCSCCCCILLHIILNPTI